MHNPHRGLSGTAIALLSALTGSFILSAPITSAQDFKPLASFTKGEIQFKHGDTTYTVPLTEGSLQAMPLPGTPAGQETRILTLGFAKGNNRVDFTVSGASGPAKINGLNIIVFSVLTSSGRSVLRLKTGDCTFTLTRADTQGAEGTATCTGDMDDGRGGKGPAVSGVKFSVAR